jgi:hypothetical protein
MAQDSDARIRAVMRYGGTATLVVGLLHAVAIVFRWLGG